MNVGMGSPLRPSRRRSLSPRLGADVRCSLASAALLAAPLAAWGQDQATLDPLIVSGESEPSAAIGSRLDLLPNEESAAVEVIDREQMRERGVRDTTEAVTGAPGFSSANQGGNLSGFSARGFNDIAVLYDGISLGTPGMFARPQGTWIYERVETISGPSSILHGEGAISGAVNFVPRRPDPDETSTDVLMSGGSFDSTRIAAGRGGPTGIEGLSYRIDGERQTSDGYADNAELRRDTFSTSLAYEATDRLSLSANLVYLDDELPPYFGAPVDRETGEPTEALARSNFNARDGRIEGDELRFSFDADYRMTSDVRFSNRFYAYTGERDWANVESSEFDDGVVTQRFAFSLDHDQTYFANRSDVTFNHAIMGRASRSVVGLEVSRDDFRSTRSRRPNIDRNVGDPQNPDRGTIDAIGFDRSESVFETERDTIALFGENRLELTDRFSLISGLRGEWIRLDVRENATAGGRFVDGSEDFTTVDGRLGFVWDATQRLTLFGQASTGSQFALNPNIPKVSEFDQDLERSRGLELGARGSASDGRWQWEATLFDIEKRNRLVDDPDNPTEQRQVGRQTSQGIELSGYWQPLPQLELEANGSILSAELEDEAGLDGNTPANVPEQLANLWATWSFTPGTSARAHVRYVGEAEASNANNLEVPSYTRLNLSASHTLSPGLKLTGRVRNVTDERYYTQAQFGPQFYVGDERSGEIELSWSF